MIAIFGANGLSGRALIEQLDSNVLAVLRQPSDDPFFSDKSCAVVDAMQAGSCDSFFATYQPNIVVSFIGGKKEGIRSDAVGNINLINGLQKHSPHSHLILITSLGCGEQWSLLSEKAQFYLGEAIQAKNQAEAHLQQSGLNWTILRPSGLNTDDNEQYHLYPQTESLEKLPHQYISRKGLAKAIQHIIAEPQHFLHQIYSVGL
ncbi:MULTISPECIES: NAD(P)-binding oxidoreductase [Glaesserella]|uniref:Nucleoside-diphosphate sugar epimerase n=1 Tax=Glaesserella australis TaxID=2094024 RepID=A0A328C3G9_9PAST|nr:MULTISPECIES: NAD(P)-binding oxidoreductase [Glaesserella]AUI66780.1 nucleoside-diphosphate sugar epimerase [Glaesserella sp. 15-184]RAL19832.1 nucleoside-diphosphate sugar epimerase [Glaesserella australis]